MNGLAERAELAKITALLGVPEAELSYLKQFDATVLRRFREQATGLLFDANSKRLAGLAAATRLLPTGLAAKIAAGTIPGSLAGRLAGLLDPARALDLARKVPPDYLAEMTPYLDPRRIQPILSRIPAGLVKEVATLLSARGDYISMGRLVSLLPDDVVRTTMPVVRDNLVLRAGFVMEDDTRMGDMIAMLPEERLRGLMRAAYELQLWPEALSVLSRLDDKTRGHLADVAAGEEDEVLNSMALVAHEQGYWDAALPMVRSMSLSSRRRFATLPVFSQASVIESIVRTAAGHELWAELLPLVPLLPEQARRDTARIALRLDTAVQERVLADAGEHALWAPLVLLASAKDDALAWADLPWDVAGLVSAMDPAEFDAFLREIDDAGLWERGLTVLDEVPGGGAARERVTTRAAELGLRDPAVNS